MYIYVKPNAKMLPTLPEDVLVLIMRDFKVPNHDMECPIEYESEWRGRTSQCITTLRNACLVSKSLHRIARPILYYHFSDKTS